MSYLISTLAPTSSSFFLIGSASSLVMPLLIGFGRAFDERFRFGQAEAREFANGLDDLDLLGADFAEDGVEFGLLGGRRSGSRAGAAASPQPEPRRETPYFSSSCFDELREFEDGEFVDLFDEFGNVP